MKTKFYRNLIIALLICVGGGWLCGLVTQKGVHDWYPHLIHPPGTPPDVVFPIVWTLLYTMMAVSLACLLSSSSSNKIAALLLFGLQLGLNFIWSWLFFAMRSPFLALIDLLLLWVFVIATIVAFKKHSTIGAYLLLPYLAWITYAGYLNLFIWINNT